MLLLLLLSFAGTEIPLGSSQPLDKQEVMDPSSVEVLTSCQVLPGEGSEVYCFEEDMIVVLVNFMIF